MVTHSQCSHCLDVMSQILVIPSSFVQRHHDTIRDRHVSCFCWSLKELLVLVFLSWGLWIICSTNSFRTNWRGQHNSSNNKKKQSLKVLILNQPKQYDHEHKLSKMDHMVLLDRFASCLFVFEINGVPQGSIQSCTGSRIWCSDLFHSWRFLSQGADRLW